MRVFGKKIPSPVESDFRKQIIQENTDPSQITGYFVRQHRAGLRFGFCLLLITEYFSRSRRGVFVFLDKILECEYDLDVRVLVNPLAGSVFRRA